MSKKTEDIIVFICILSVFALITLLIFTFFIKLIFSEAAATTIGVGLMSAGGSIIGGSLTLLGVLWTLNESKNSTLYKQAIKTRFIFTRINPHLTSLQNSIKSINPSNVNENLDRLKKDGKKLRKEIQNIYVDIHEINLELLKVINSIEFYNNEMLSKLSNFQPGVTDQEIKSLLEKDRNFLAIYDEHLGNIYLDSRQYIKLPTNK